MVKFVGGAAQAGYVERVRGLDPSRCLVVPVDVGKRSAVALIANHHGEVMADPVESRLTTSGTDRLVDIVAQVEVATGAESVRIDVEPRATSTGRSALSSIAAASTLSS